MQSSSAAHCNSCVLPCMTTSHSHRRMAIDFLDYFTVFLHSQVWFKLQVHLNPYCISAYPEYTGDVNISQSVFTLTNRTRTTIDCRQCPTPNDDSHSHKGRTVLQSIDFSSPHCLFKHFGSWRSHVIANHGAINTLYGQRTSIKLIYQSIMIGFMSLTHWRMGDVAVTLNV